MALLLIPLEWPEVLLLMSPMGVLLLMLMKKLHLPPMEVLASLLLLPMKTRLLQRLPSEAAPLLLLMML